MEAKTKIKLLSLEPYRHLFPKADAKDHTLKKGASVSDTVNLIPKVVKSSAWQVERFVAQELKGLPVYDACKKLWHFVKYHIEYVKDERGKEQVRSPRRLIHDVKGDCDCFTTFIDTCLYTLGVRGIINRITKYSQDYFQHIYPVIPDGKGGEIIMDCVVNKFNYEEPYSEKKDYNMDLQFLDGIEGAEDSGQSQSAYGYKDLLGDLGKLLKKRAEKRADSPAPAKKPGILKKPIFQKKATAKNNAAPKKQVGKKVLKVVNKVNKVNPATVLLRAGILASMKLNVFKVAEKLKWGYATREYAQSKGMDMSKYDKVKDVLAKTEKIFFAAGGDPANLKKSILTGNGNKNREVSGIGETEKLSDILGEVFQDEFVNGMDGFEGFGELGEPATATSLAAASTTMGSLAALLKSIGDLFPKRSSEPKQKKGLFKRNATSTEASEDESSQEAESSESSETAESSPEEQVSEEPTKEESSPSSEEDSNLPTESAEEPSEEHSGEPEANQEESTDGILSGTSQGLKIFWQKNKGWLKPVGIGSLVLTGILIYANSQKDGKENKKPSESLNGFKRHKKKKGGNRHHNGGKKSVIALM